MLRPVGLAEVVLTSGLVGLWAWTAYHVVLFLLGWSYSKRLLRAPSDSESFEDPADLPSFTIIVPAKDEETVIRTTLEAVVGLRYPRDLVQVIVVEDGSKDATRDICERFALAHPDLLFLHEDVSSVKAAALNRATPHAHGDILLFLDADAAFDSDLLMRAATFFRDHPDVDAAQAVTEAYTDHRNLVAKLDQYETAFWSKGILLGKDRLGLFVPLCGSGMFIRRKALDAVGPWDVRRFAEDIDMAVRLHAAGVAVRVLPARVGRQPPYSVRDFVSQRRRWWGGALQVLPRAFALWRNPKVTWRRKIDAVLLLTASLVLVPGTVYLALAASLSPLGLWHPAVMAATFVGIATSQMVLVGAVVVHAIARRTVRDLDLIPGMYVYWALQLFTIFAVLVGVALRRPPRWKVTAKRTIHATRGAPAMLEPVSSTAILPAVALPRRPTVPSAPHSADPFQAAGVDRDL